jgi:general secretion pathway protein D
LRSSGGSGGGGGGGGQGAVNPLNTTATGGTGGSVGGQGGLNYITQVTLAQTPSAAARAFFSALGVNLLQPPGKAVFFNDRAGIILVRATEQDLDTIDQAIQVLNAVPPQVHIKARFIEVEQDDDNQFGLDWYLGQFNIGKQVVGTGGSSGSLNVPVSSANPLGAFPGSSVASLIPGSATDQWLTSGLRNTAPAIATITGILTNPNFLVVLHALEQRTGSENLGEPEVTTTSGRQTQMRATSVLTFIYGYNFQQGQGGISTGTSTPP